MRTNKIILIITCMICSINASDHASDKPIPLENQGNTCYLNSTLQVFDNIPVLKSCFRDAYNHLSHVNNEQKRLLYHVARVQTYMHNPLYDNTIKQNCTNASREMQKLTESHQTQQDASELFNHVMEQLENIDSNNKETLGKLFNVNNRTIIQEPATHTTLNTPKEDQAWPIYIGPFSEHDKPDQKTSLASLLTSHAFAASAVEYTDSHNVKHHNAQKKHEITKLPEYLPIQITTRYMTQEQQERMLLGGTPQSTLLNTTIEIPEVLQFTADNNTESGDALPLISYEHGQHKGIVSYILNSCIAYSGNGNSGHYWAHVRKGNQWYTCNDSIICPREFNSQWDVSTGIVPYFLVYECVDNNDLQDYLQRRKQRQSSHTQHTVNDNADSQENQSPYIKNIQNMWHRYQHPVIFGFGAATTMLLYNIFNK